MTHHHRDPPRTFRPIRSCVFPKMLVSGCSFTHNFHYKYVVTWPYYLRDFADIQNVYDVSLSGGGSQHIFNSIVYEIETNPEIDPKDTMVLVMWSGLSRTDVVAETSVVAPWVRSSVPTAHRPGEITDGVYRFDDRFSTFSIQCLESMKNDPTPIARMQHSYKLVVGWDAQVLQSLLNIVSLAGYLDSKGFTWMFMSWQNPQPDLDIVPGELSQRVGKLMTQSVLPLGDYARKQRQLDATLHPTPAANMAWTQSHLIPALDLLGITQ